MKNILIASVLIISALVLFFSCSDENLSDNGITEGDSRLQVKSVAVYNSGSGSEGGTISEFVNGDTIGLYLPEYRRGYPFPYSARENYRWHLSEPVFLSSEPTRLFAYYPFRIKEHAYLWDKHVNVEHTTQTDYMHGKAIFDYIASDQPYAYIRMIHVLALIQFQFVKNGYPHDCSLMRVSISNSGGVKHLPGSGKLDLESGNIVETAEYDRAATITPRNMNFFTPPASEKDFARVLVMPIDPVKNHGDIYFEFVIDGRVYTWPMEAGTHWQAGMKYTYRVEMVAMARSVKDSGSPAQINVVLTQTSNNE
ncbi:fimbrillin family protein [Dysgonomonas sp. UBA7698]|uniref:fimbrillin family protein n=1 Tax=Dysgonomonas sp. UBA7698 TaxID=1946427 RepID=UPI0025C0284D|nr:fimbrillin family protein [Dysgonomonas sp. UBA7698]